MVGAVLFLFLVVFGNQITGINTAYTFDQSVDRAFSDIGDTTSKIVQEFTFPFTNIANAVEVFPFHHNFRYGIQDFVVGLNQVLPSQILGTIEGENINSLNTSFFKSDEDAGTVPVDIVSFGYMSFGVAGVMLIGLLFGMVVRMFETLFSYRGNMVACMIFSAWMIFFAFRIMYGNPGMSYVSSFVLLVSTMLIYLFAKPSRRLRVRLKRRLV